MIEELKKYADGMNASSEVVGWLETTGAKALKIRGASQSIIEHILDFMVSSAAPKRLQKMSYEDAKRKAEEWNKANQKKGRNLEDSSDDITSIHDFSDGSKIVELHTKNALKREGFMMSHCVGGYSLSKNCQIYSYRDKNNGPHATFEVRKNGSEIVQIKGKGNGPIHPKYIGPILEFLRSIKIEIRPSDMRNLGYFHIPSEFISYINESKAISQITMIGGEAYAF